METKKILHILRNPYGKSSEEIREAQLTACDLLDEKWCKWTDDNTGSYTFETTCANTFMFMSGTPVDNNMKYCPFCGKRVEVVKYDESEDHF